jgi:hypothetical protein
VTQVQTTTNSRRVEYNKIRESVVIYMRYIALRQHNKQFNLFLSSNVLLPCVCVFFIIYSVCIQPMLHHFVYHGIFTFFFFFLLCYVTSSILACSLGVVTESGHFSIVPVACGICF